MPKHALPRALFLAFPFGLALLIVPNVSYAACTGAGGACSPGPCCPDTQCFGGTCELVTGASGCSANSDCLSDNCSGIGDCWAADAPNGASHCFTDADCSPADQLYCVANKCVEDEGATCFGNNAACTSNICNGSPGTCACSNNDVSCTTTSDCCNSGSGVVCVASVCVKPLLGYCNVGADCASDFCPGTHACNCTLTHEDNSMGPATYGTCSASSDCCDSPDATCINSVCLDLNGDACTYNASADLNTWCVGGPCQPSGVCPSSPLGYNYCATSADCDSDQLCEMSGPEAGYCLQKTGQPCTVNLQCVSNNCAGTSCAANDDFGPCPSNADCATGYSCDPKPNDLTFHLCQGTTGTACGGVDNECISETCNPMTNVCECGTSGQNCSSAGDCCSPAHEPCKANHTCT